MVLGGNKSALRKLEKSKEKTPCRAQIESASGADIRFVLLVWTTLRMIGFGVASATVASGKEMQMAYTHFLKYIADVLIHTRTEAKSDGWKMVSDHGVVTLQCQKCNASLKLTLQSKDEAILHRKLCIDANKKRRIPPAETVSRWFELR